MTSFSTNSIISNTVPPAANAGVPAATAVVTAPSLASRMTHEEELRLGTRLLECRHELLGIALADPASSAELDRIAHEVANGQQRIEAVVDALGTSQEQRRKRFDGFRRDVQSARAEASACSPHPAVPYPEHEALLDTLALQWESVDRVLQNSWIGRTDATDASGSPDMPAELRQRVQALQAEVQHIVNRFVSSNQRLVWAVARRYRNLGLSREDLMQDGNIGLLRGVEKFDPRRGAPFASYATWWIRESVRRGLADHSRTIRLPVNALATRYRVGQASRRLAHELGREPSGSELAHATGVDADSISEVMLMSREPLSLDAPRGGDAETTLGNLLPDRWSTKPDEHASARELAKELDALLEGLTPRERQVLRLRFGLDGHDERTLEEIGRSFDLTRERVRQIVAAALGKLQRETRLRHLDL